MTIKLSFVAAVAAVVLAPAAARADFVLDTGVPTGTGLPQVLDGNDYMAAEFSLGAGQTITGVQAFLNSTMDAPGATFTIALYAGSDLTSRSPTQLFSAQATYTADGWNGLNNLSWAPGTAGLYWIALEVGTGDSVTGLAAPTPASGGSVAAAAFAFNAGSGYQTAGAGAFGVQVTAVPLPPSLWLVSGGLLGLVGVARRRQAA